MHGSWTPRTALRPVRSSAVSTRIRAAAFTPIPGTAERASTVTPAPSRHEAAYDRAPARRHTAPTEPGEPSRPQPYIGLGQRRCTAGGLSALAIR
jgi:hypothetical protein